MKLILFPAIFLLCFSCATSKREQFPEMYSERPLSIVVLPITNNTTAADSSGLYLSTIAEPLSNMGYYVYPIEITNKIFIEQGITSGAELKNVPAQKYRKLFGADAALSVTINKWDTSYFVFGGNVTVDLDCKIISTKTGRVLWSKYDQISVPIQEDSGNLVVNALVVAIKTAAIDYVPIAKRLNKRIFDRLPAGKYSRDYNQDGE